MKKHELEAAIAAAQAELERLQAIEPEPDSHPMTLPVERVRRGDRYWRVSAVGAVQPLTEDGDSMDATVWEIGNYYATKEQAEAYADAFEVLRLIRRQPGIVDPSKRGAVFRPDVDIGSCLFIRKCMEHASYLPYFMFPCFESLHAAQAAVDAVGAERIIKTAKWLTGVM